ncbi:MAG: N-acetylmuramoyl-L-alanine amidase [Coriobacteriales bacterium]|nr:N-acetylmuramoyl-L-alanine amidase [Coriobacteriales bacterium]
MNKKNKIILIVSLCILAIAIASFVLIAISCSNKSSESAKDDTYMEATKSESSEDVSTQSAQNDRAQKLAQLESQLNIQKDIRESFNHGPKPAQYQKYIVLHDTEGDGNAKNVIDYWDGNGNLVAAHFVVNKDGSIWQCVEMDNIAHHAGYGNKGHNESFGITEDGRDDMKATVPIGSYCPDYGMNAWSIGIEMVHVGNGNSYPEAQLNALDLLIEYIDTYYGFQSTITDHKAWREGNSDTSPEFATYLKNYKSIRKHA